MSNGEIEILKMYSKLYKTEYQKFLDSKLPGVNFINVLRVHFLYKCLFSN